MYATNIIEGFHRQLRTVTKSKGTFQSEEALMKLLFLVKENIVAKWNTRTQLESNPGAIIYYLWRQA